MMFTSFKTKVNDIDIYIIIYGECIIPHINNNDNSPK